MASPRPPRVTTGYVSEVKLKPRRDWSWLRELMKALEPGKRVSFRLPSGTTGDDMYSIACTMGRRLRRTGDRWRVSVHQDGKTVHLFLVPTE